MSNVTIRINSRTKAGKNLIELARNLAEKYQGIEILQDEEDEYLAQMIKEGLQSKTLSEEESAAFVSELQKLAGNED